jgi:hypothetical protein
MATTNCNIYKEKDYIYCGRGKGRFNNPENCKAGDIGLFGNPVIINIKCPICGGLHFNSGETLPCFKKYLLVRLSVDADFKTAFKTLKDKKLGCFCKPKPCHTDIMIQLLDSESEL